MLVVCVAQMYQMRQRLSSIDFGDVGKNTLRDEFCSMADNAHAWKIRGLTPNEKAKRKAEIEELTKWMHLLISSKSPALPTEMEFVLRCLLAQWIGNNINDLTLVFLEGEYKVRRFNKDAIGYRLFGTTFGVNFTKDPVFIGIPRECKEDLLSNIALFHEMGHIVDTQISLMTDVKDSIIKSTNKDYSKRIIREYFPKLFNDKVFDESILVSYIKEYIADLFSAQYLGNYIIDYLDFVETGKKTDDSPTHPPFEKRKKVVEDFINCMTLSNQVTSNYLLKYIIDSFHFSGKGDLCIRWSPISGNSFLMGSPVTLTNNDELFSVFKQVWDVVYLGVTQVEKARHLPPNTLSHYAFYDSLNSTVKDSISCFMNP